MSTSADSEWLDANQRYLLAALDGLRATLRAHLAAGRGAPLPAPEPAGASAGPAPQEGEPALERLVALFGLTPFERDVLLLCAGAELDAAFAALCAEAQGDPARTAPSWGLALAALPGAHWSALAPTAPLRYWRLVEPRAGEGLTGASLRIDERALHYLTGVAYLDERLHGLLDRRGPPEQPPPSQAGAAARAAAIWRRAEGAWPAIQLCGEPETGLSEVASLVCAELGLSLYALRAVEVPAGAGERDGLLRLWGRESALGDAALLLECDDDDGPEVRRAAAAWVERCHGPLLVAGREPLRVARRQLVRVDVRRPGPAEQRELWRAALGPHADRLNGQLDGLTSQFSLGMPAIAGATQALRHSAPEDAAQIGELLWEACRAQARVRLDDLAQRIESRAGWDDLVLPAPQAQILREAVAHVRRRALVYETWGFAARSERGLGISALFAGPSGTGKTLAAEVLANELRLDLYRIDLSAVVSKYIGETEKNLRRVFDAAEAGGAVLLFDEADALFGKRSEVKDSHDRYANIEVSYLLQRMEQYRGLAILTTNQHQALDNAFTRRIRFIVHFPFPDAAQRAEIWRRAFPAATPTLGLDVGRLARLNVAGGNIRNIAMGAAFLAADEGAPVTMRHILGAARAEYAKLERPLTDAEVAGWS